MDKNVYILIPGDYYITYSYGKKFPEYKQAVQSKRLILTLVTMAKTKPV